MYNRLYDLLKGTTSKIKAISVSSRERYNRDNNRKTTALTK
jgi:hypothetical protein